jgi:hypothetical protein
MCSVGLILAVSSDHLEHKPGLEGVRPPPFPLGAY